MHAGEETMRNFDIHDIHNATIEYTARNFDDGVLRLYVNYQHGLFTETEWEIHRWVNDAIGQTDIPADGRMAAFYDIVPREDVADCFEPGEKYTAADVYDCVGWDDDE